MKESMLHLAFIGAACLLNACGGSGGSTQSGVATHFSVTAPAAVSIGEFFNLTITAVDSQKNLVPGYSGVVLFTSTDPQIGLGGPPLTGGRLTKSTKFLVHERREVIEGLLVTLRPIGQESRHFVGGRITHVIDDADLGQ